MMSCFGIIYDTSGGTHVINSKSASWTSGGVTYNYNNAYTLFDADYPNGSKPSALNFVPYYCVDMLAGAVYQQNAFIKGTIEAQIFYHNITKPAFTPQNRAATLSDNCGDVVMSLVPWTVNNSWVELTLPHASAQEGRIITIYSGTLFQVTGGVAYTKIYAQESAGIFRYDEGYNVTSAINVYVGDSVEFYSDGTQWYFLCIRKGA
jgi:hypothetical protein